MLIRGPRAAGFRVRRRIRGPEQSIRRGMAINDAMKFVDIGADLVGSEMVVGYQPLYQVLLGDHQGRS